MKTGLMMAAIALTSWWFGYAIGSEGEPEQRAAYRRIRVELQGSMDRRNFSTLCASGEMMNQFRIVSKEGPTDVSSDIFEPWKD